MRVMSLGQWQQVNICRVNKANPLSDSIRRELLLQFYPCNLFIGLFIDPNLQLELVGEHCKRKKKVQQLSCFTCND